MMITSKFIQPSQTGPKIVLDHVCVLVYIIYIIVNIAFPHCWLYTMP